jgi:hypothetical protein
MKLLTIAGGRIVEEEWKASNSEVISRSLNENCHLKISQQQGSYPRTLTHLI